MTLPQALAGVVARAAAHNRPVVEGRVKSLRGVAVEVSGLRAVVGDLCTIHGTRGPVPAEVVGFANDTSVLMPLGELLGIGPFDAVTSHGRPLVVPTGPRLLGRVVDALGRPLDGQGEVGGAESAVTCDAPPALSRTPIDEPMPTGVSTIDAFLTCGKGQRIGIFAGSGVGKSTLLGMIARGSAAPVNVIALIGERGREVGDFIRDSLGPEGLQKSVVVVATSDAPAMLRMKGAFTAVAIAEAFRSEGKDVLFMMDSVTRFAGAVREIGLAAGEPPTLRGYPPSLFAQLPRLVERLGSDGRGTITGLLTVLVDGDDFNEPVSDAVRGYLDGHIVLSRAIAQRGRYPAIDVLASVSRLMEKVASERHRADARAVRELLAVYEEGRDLIQVGAYKKGSDAQLDRAVQKMGAIEELLVQAPAARSFEATLEALARIALDSEPVSKPPRRPETELAAGRSQGGFAPGPSAQGQRLAE
jgi:FliI/YscN family ATPase